MLQTSQLQRVFIHTEDGQAVRLTDPNDKFSPETVLNFYSGTYPILTNAKINGPEIKNDAIEYEFVSTIGKKG
jgi:PRTRC genetic system protein C